MRAILKPRFAGLIAELKGVLPHCDYTDHYGQSETGLLTILKPWESEGRPGSIPPATREPARVASDGGRQPAHQRGAFERRLRRRPESKGVYSGPGMNTSLWPSLATSCFKES